VKKRSIVLALCCFVVCSPVSAKTFVGVLYPLFGPAAAIGLVELADELKPIPDVEVATYQYQSWPSLVDDINRQPKGTHILIVGYSLGANNAILVAQHTDHVDSIIALQPSMFTSTPTVPGNVARVIEIYNPNRWMTFGGMGSQKLEGANIKYIENNDSHPAAQFNSDFRTLVKSEIVRLTAEDSVRVAQAESPKSPHTPKKPAATKPKVPKDERPEHRREVLAALQPNTTPTVLPEEVLSSANSSSASAQRPLTIADMADYVKRTYQNRPKVDLAAGTPQ
jgi:hypothetical protein